MDWNAMYPKETQPTMEQMEQAVAMPQWRELLDALAQLDAKFKPSHSGCSGQPGWNLKCARKSKMLATLYPQVGRYLALITVAERIAPAIEPILPSLSKGTQERYWSIKPLNGSRWLMLDAGEEGVHQDILALLEAKAAAV